MSKFLFKRKVAGGNYFVAFLFLFVGLIGLSSKNNIIGIGFIFIAIIKLIMCLIANRLHKHMSK